MINGLLGKKVFRQQPALHSTCRLKYHRRCGAYQPGP